MGFLRSSDGVGVVERDGVIYAAPLPSGPIAVLDGMAAVIWREACAGDRESIAERVAAATDASVDEIRGDPPPARSRDDSAMIAKRESHAWHFLVDDATARVVRNWDPDADPNRFASGLGHNLLELYARLRARGCSVTIGARIPRDTGLVISYHQAWNRVGELALALRAAPYRTAVIRSDAPLWWRNLLPADLIVVPNRASVAIWTGRTRSRVLYRPALPQRGMIPRDRRRPGVQRMVFKGNPENVPGYLLDPGFRDALRECGVELVIDAPTATDGGDQRWHDFREADVLLCVRAAAPDDSLLNKPPTRLINAWAAGAIPVVGPEPAYLELVHDWVDGVVVHGERDLLGAVCRLAQDRTLAEELLCAAAARGREFDRDALLIKWIEVLAAAAGPRRGFGEVGRRRVVVIGSFGRWVLWAVAWRAREALRRTGK